MTSLPTDPPAFISQMSYQVIKSCAWQNTGKERAWYQTSPLGKSSCLSPPWAGCWKRCLLWFAVEGWWPEEECSHSSEANLIPTSTWEGGSRSMDGILSRSWTTSRKKPDRESLDTGQPDLGMTVASQITSQMETGLEDWDGLWPCFSLESKTEEYRDTWQCNGWFPSTTTHHTRLPLRHPDSEVIATLSDSWNAALWLAFSSSVNCKTLRLSPWEADSYRTSTPIYKP